MHFTQDDVHRMYLYIFICIFLLPISTSSTGQTDSETAQHEMISIYNFMALFFFAASDWSREGEEDEA